MKHYHNAGRGEETKMQEEAGEQDVTYSGSE